MIRYIIQNQLIKIKFFREKFVFTKNLSLIINALQINF